MFDVLSETRTPMANIIKPTKDPNLFVGPGRLALAKLEQVLAAKPTRDFDEEWGKFRKPDAFVEMVYIGLKPGKK